MGEAKSSIQNEDNEEVITCSKIKKRGREEFEKKRTKQTILGMQGPKKKN